MTYDELIDVVRDRGKRFLINTADWELGSVYNAINAAARDIQAVSKPTQTTAPLSLVAGTQSYTISSAIASDVDEINFIRVGDAEIYPLSYDDLERLSIDGVATENDAANDESETSLYFRVIGDTLKLSFLPSQALTATVFYTKKVAQSFYSPSVGSTAIPFDDLWLNCIIYETLSILAENQGLGNESAMYHSRALEAQAKANDAKPYCDFGQQLTYHDLD